LRRHFEKLAAAKVDFMKMEAKGIIRRSSSPWASPLHLVKKPDGSWRPCGDFRCLNNVTVPETYPLPNMMDFSLRVTRCKFFSTIDLRKGYFQIFMHPDDIPKTAIITPFCLFEFLCVPFGLRNAGSTFQRMMDRVMAGLPFVFVYLNDIIVASKSMEQHQRDVEEVSRCLRSAGLVINEEKCEFAVQEIQFLGHHVTSEGIRPLPDIVAAIQKHPKLTTVKQLQALEWLTSTFVLSRRRQGSCGHSRTLLRGFEGHCFCGVNFRNGESICGCQGGFMQSYFAGSPSSGWGAGINGGYLFRLCWSSFATKVIFLISMAALGFLFQEDGASSSPVFGIRPGIAGLLCRHLPFQLYVGGPDFYHLHRP